MKRPSERARSQHGKFSTKFSTRRYGCTCTSLSIERYGLLLNQIVQLHAVRLYIYLFWCWSLTYTLPGYMYSCRSTSSTIFRLKILSTTTRGQLLRRRCRLWPSRLRVIEGRLLSRRRLFLSKSRPSSIHTSRRTGRSGVCMHGM